MAAIAIPGPRRHHHHRRASIFRGAVLCLTLLAVGAFSNPVADTNQASLSDHSCTENSPSESCNNINTIDSNSNTNTNTPIMTDGKKKYEQDGDEARQIAQYLPYFPFKGIPRFYDIGGFLEKPDVFQQIVDIFVERYSEIGIDSIAGLDARGFILGPPIALAMKKPFIMMRKQGKMPNSLSSDEYTTEYGKRSGLTVQKDKIKKGDRVLIIDDLVATGGTLSSSINLVHMLGGEVVECACVVELKMFIDPSEESGLPSRTKLFTSQKINHVPVWGLISEDVLTNEAVLPEGYVDDGEEH